MPNGFPIERRGSWPSSALDEAEKGIYRRRQSLVAPPPFVYTMVTSKPTAFETPLSPTSPVHEGITPCASVPELFLPSPAESKANAIDVVEKPVTKSTPAKPRISRWILFELWFNVYRRFFTFVVLLNLIGIVLAADGIFTYAENHLGALVLGNLLCAVLMRNELFVRFLYLVFIYGLRSVSCATGYHGQGLTRLDSGHLSASSSRLPLSCNISEASTRGVPFPVQRKCFRQCRSSELTCPPDGWYTRSSTSCGIASFCIRLSSRAEW